MTTLWHTLIIKVPVDMIDYTPKGKVSVKKTLTKMGSISKSQKKPSIKIMPSKDGEVHVIEGKRVTVPELKDTMKKVKELEEKNKGKVFKKSQSKQKFEKNVKEYAQELVKKKAKPKHKPHSDLLTEDQFIDAFDTNHAGLAFEQYNPKGFEALRSLLTKLEKKEGYFHAFEALASGLYIPLPTVKKLVLKYGFRTVEEYMIEIARYAGEQVIIREDIVTNPFKTKLYKVLRFTPAENQHFKDDLDYINRMKP
jgi:hypothetical protein